MYVVFYLFLLKILDISKTVIKTVMRSLLEKHNVCRLAFGPFEEDTSHQEHISTNMQV